MVIISISMAVFLLVHCENDVKDYNSQIYFIRNFYKTIMILHAD